MLLTRHSALRTPPCFFPAMLCAFALLFAACVPVTTPPQLNHTPGPMVRVSDGLYDSGVFRAAAPAGWRVVTSAAEAPVSVIFAAPESDTLIMVGENLAEAPPPAGYSGALRSQRREVTLDNGATVIAILNAPPERWPERLAAFEAVVASITPS